ncbi:MAG: TIGR02186 family protein [Rhodospirillales bacterium]
MRRGFFALLLGLLCSAPAAGQTPALIADLSKRQIAITTGFAGTDLLLFGAVEGPGDVIVVVRGPPREQVVRRKIRIAGVWLNGESVEFAHVPVFYWVASSRPLNAIAPPAFLDQHGIGTGHLALRPAEGAQHDIPAFRAALVRNKAEADLYEEAEGAVTFLADRLFRTTVTFPANLPTGTYEAEVYLLRDRSLVSRQTTTIEVARVGLGARIHNFARQQAALYGIIAVLVALAAGWLAGVIFRRA